MTPQVHDIASSLMASLDCPRSLTVAILMRNREWVQLTELTTNPLDYSTPLAYLRAAQATDFLRKYPELETGIDKRAAALQKWRDSETLCFQTNRRLNELDDFGTLMGRPASEQVIAFVATTRKFVRRILGAGPGSSLEPRFGPGATISDPSRFTTVPDKITSKPSLTRGADPYVADWSSTAWARAVRHLGGEITYVRGNKYFTVPKDSKTDRSCGKEPSLNVAFQLALGQAIRRRLSRVGYNLDTLQDTHRRLASEYSASNEGVTIDLSSASDCVSTSLVRMLMPNEWYRALNALRSPTTDVDGKTLVLEKFSSMGNGFTFELETVIFLSCCLALQELSNTEGIVSVYGDDIIVPRSMAHLVIIALEFVGFKTNVRKTFVDGSFRESCGGDFFAGQAVRPYFLKDEPHEPQDYISLANGIRRMAYQFPETLWPAIRRTWFRILDEIPSRVRACRGPSELGDLVIFDDEVRWRYRWRSSIRYFQVYRPATYHYVRWEGFAYEVQYAAALYGVTLAGPLARRGHGVYIVPRDGVAGYKVGWTPHS